MSESAKKGIKDILADKIPITHCNVNTDKNSLVMMIEFSWGFLTTIAQSFWFFERLVRYHYWYDIILLPLNIYGNCWFFVFSTAVFAWMVIKILKRLHPIKEGVFDLNSKEGKQEYKYYKLRFWFSYYALWLARVLPLPWVDFVVMKMMGSKIGRNVCLYDSWMDTELIEVGDYVMTSINTAIISHAIYQNYFIQMKVIIEKNSITGGESIIAPGTYIEEGAILGAAATTYIGQRIKGNLIHVGAPASKTFPIVVGEKKKD